MLDESHIAVLVDRFYDKVSADPVLGAVFNPVVDDWDEHKRLLTSFWLGVTSRRGGYRGNPMAKHRPLPIERIHFQHWLGLWEATCREVLDEDAAARMIEHAHRIGTSLQSGLGLLDHGRGRALGLPLTRVR